MSSTPPSPLLLLPPAHVLTIHIMQAATLAAAAEQAFSLAALGNSTTLSIPDSFPIAVLSNSATIATRDFIAGSVDIIDITGPDTRECCHRHALHPLHRRGQGLYLQTLTAYYVKDAAKRAVATTSTIIASCATWLKQENNPFYTL
jgi:hypothetical protein